jgi:putative DNA primase/helicase
MLQILALRGENKKKTHAFFEKKWTAPSVIDLMANPESFLHDIPEEERWNLYFTSHDCAGLAPRDFTQQWIISYDIDHVEYSELEQVARVVCETVKCDYNKVAVVSSGHGLQIHIALEQPIMGEEFFKTNKPLYKLSCDLIQGALKKAKLTGDLDATVFSMRRLMRMPGTVNRKPGKPDKSAVVMQRHMEAHGWTLLGAIDVPGTSKGESIDREAFKKFPPADVKAVEAGCGFLIECKENAKTLSEPAYYAMCNILGYLPGGRELVHKYASPYPGYTPSETDAKIDQALAASGPRTCKSISQLSDKCKVCPHFTNNKIVTPISIKGEDYIKSEGLGFYHEIFTGNSSKLVPAYEDLQKYFWRVKGPSMCVGRNIPYVYDRDEHYWKSYNYEHFKGFAMTHFDPKPRTHIAEEFAKTMAMTNQTDVEWFDNNEGLVNMMNGVYNIQENRLMSHNRDYGFRTKVTFAFDPLARCPVFMKFLGEVTCEDEKLAAILQEFVGYSLSGDSCWLGKGLILLGGGRNGKSTFNEVVKALVGKGNFSSIGLSSFSDANSLSLIEGKLINIANENDPQSLLNSDVFKSAITGEELKVKKLFSDVYIIRNRTKFIFSCNEFPASKDSTEGLFRRIQIVPFRANFDDEIGNVDKHIATKLLTELPGIFNWAIEGYLRLKKTQRLTRSEEADEILEEFKGEQDNVSNFIAHNLEITTRDTDTVATSDLYKAYVYWCEVECIKYGVKSNVAFAMSISQEFRSRKIQKIRKKVYKGYKGIRLKQKDSLL